MSTDHCCISLGTPSRLKASLDVTDSRLFYGIPRFPQRRQNCRLGSSRLLIFQWTVSVCCNKPWHQKTCSVFVCGGGGGGGGGVQIRLYSHRKVTHATKNFKTSKRFILKVNIKKGRACTGGWPSVSILNSSGWISFQMLNHLWPPVIWVPTLSSLMSLESCQIDNLSVGLVAAELVPRWLPPTIDANFDL